MKRYLIFLFGLLVISLSSCKDNEREEDEMDNDIESLTTDEETFDERVEEMRQRNATVDAIEGNPQLSTFAQGLNVWNVENRLDNMDGRYIIFAPTNTAYSNVYTEQGKDRLETNPDEVISYHIVMRDLDMDQLKSEIKNANGKLMLPTFSEEEITAGMDGDNIVLTGNTGIKANITDSFEIENGTAYVIDAVLLPEGLDTEVTIEAEK